MLKQLESIYNDNFNLYELLNTLAINGTQYKKKDFFIELIKKLDFCKDNEVEANLFFDKCNNFFNQKIYYTCQFEDDSIPATILQAKCEFCDDKIENHEYFSLYKFDKEKELSNYNTDLLKKFFSEKSIPVIKDLRANFNNVIPFIGAGISKELGLPLWLEMFEYAKKELPTESHFTFNEYYKKGDINKLISFIMDLSSSLDTDRKLRHKMILPQVNTPLKKEKTENSTAHYILRLGCPYVITTNYDKILENINSDFILKYDESKNLKNFSGFEILDKNKYIFHLHGDISDLDSMIVTNNDYENMYSSDQDRLVLSGLIMKKRLLFMGFSLNDKYFSQEFSNICAANKNYGTNYMIGLEDDNTNDLIKDNVNHITINIKSINKEPYDSKEQYRYFLKYIKGEIFIESDLKKRISYSR